DLTGAASGDKLFRPRVIGRSSDHKDGAGRPQRGQKFAPGGVGPVLVGMRGADPDCDPGPRANCANLSPTALRRVVGTRKFGSVEESGPFRAAIKARSQSIG